MTKLQIDEAFCSFRDTLHGVVKGSWSPIELIILQAGQAAYPWNEEAGDRIEDL